MAAANTSKRLLTLSLLGAALIAAGGHAAKAEAQTAPIKIIVTAVGRPPIFSNTFIDAAESLGYFKDAGLDVSMRWFQRASDTAKIILTGEADVGWTASTPGLNLMASGGEVVAIAGQNTQDWLVASNDADVKTCADLKGKTIAADGINNARYLYLGAVLETCKLSLKDVTPIDLANAALVKAGIAGQVHDGVFHVDELAEIGFRTGKGVASNPGTGLHRQGSPLRNDPHDAEGDLRQSRGVGPLRRSLDPHPALHEQPGAARPGEIRRNRVQGEPD